MTARTLQAGSHTSPSLNVCSLLQRKCACGKSDGTSCGCGQGREVQHESSSEDTSLSYELEDAPHAATAEKRVVRWLRMHAKEIVAEEVHSHVDRRAIAGAIAYEALKNKRGRWTPSSFGPGKVHVTNLFTGLLKCSWATAMKKTIASEVEDEGLLPKQNLISRILLLRTPEGSIRYIGAIMNAQAKELAQHGYSVRCNPPLLGLFYNRDTLQDIRTRFKTTHPSALSTKDGLMGQWIGDNLGLLSRAVGVPNHGICPRPMTVRPAATGDASGKSGLSGGAPPRGSTTGKPHTDEHAHTESSPQIASATIEGEPRDAKIESLKLSERARRAAYVLKAAHPEVVFTSGRRDRASQADAMADNIVKNGREYIGGTYRKHVVSRACQQWVDANPQAVSKSEIQAGLLQVLNRFSDNEVTLLSRHLTGDAFDVQPVVKNADAIKETLSRLPEMTKFLECEAGLERWHVQFGGTRDTSPRKQCPKTPVRHLQ